MASALPRLRAATSEDEPFLRRLYRTTRIEERAGLPWTQQQVRAFCDAQFDAQATGYRSAFPDAEHLIVCGAAEPAGRMIKARMEAGLVLVDIALLPAFRGRGWGSVLLRSLQEEARAAALPVCLHVDKGSRALSLYRRHGFAVAGEEALRVWMRWNPPSPSEAGW